MPGPQHQLGWRLLAEFSVIVLGVLVALGVDSWVERRADQAAEREALEGLRDDLILNIEDLGEVSAGNFVQVARLEWLRSR